MPVIDQHLTWRKVEERLATETDPVLVRNLELLLQHMKAEASLDMESLMATVSEKALYQNFTPSGQVDIVGKAAVRQFYENFAASGAHRLHLHQARGAPQPPHLLDHARGVRDRIGVRHRADRGVAAQCGGPGSGFHGLRVLPARLAQVRVQIDQAGQRDKAIRVDQLGAGRAGVAPECGNGAVGDEQVGRRAAEDRNAFQQVLHLCPPSRR